MKISLNYAQALTVKQALEWSLNDDYPESDPINKHIQRIIDKIEAEMQKERNV